jgi:hypothetical protein
MRSRFVLLAAVAAVAACEPLTDAAHNPVTLPAPYNSLAADEPIENGKPVILTAPQQEAVVAGVNKWMKDPHRPGSVTSAVRARRAGSSWCVGR